MYSTRQVVSETMPEERGLLMSEPGKVKGVMRRVSNHICNCMMKLIALLWSVKRLEKARVG